jgi:hypothetical protein
MYFKVLNIVEHKLIHFRTYGTIYFYKQRKWVSKTPLDAIYYYSWEVMATLINPTLLLCKISKGYVIDFIDNEAPEVHRNVPHREEYSRSEGINNISICLSVLPWGLASFNSFYRKAPLQIHKRPIFKLSCVSKPLSIIFYLFIINIYSSKFIICAHDHCMYIQFWLYFIILYVW